MDGYPKISPIAAGAGLGTVVARHRMSLWVELSYLTTFIVIGLFCLILGDNVGRGIGLGSLALAAVIGVVTWRKAHKVLYLCTGGLLTTVGRRSVATARCRWEDVTHVRLWATRIYNLGASEYGIYEQFVRCTVYQANGDRIHLHRGPYNGAAELATLIEQRTAPVIRSRREHELSTTGKTTFGPIVLTHEGLQAGQAFAAWSSITLVKRQRVRLRIWTGGRRPTISRQTRTIPDLAVLLAMTDDRQLPRRSPDRST